MPNPNPVPEPSRSMCVTSIQARPAAPTWPVGAEHPIAQATRVSRHR